jgi:hypothetical protein
MTLSDEDRRRIEEEEYRKLARERLESTLRIEADIRTSGDQRLEMPDRDIGAQLYDQWKGDAKGSASVIHGIAQAFYRDAKPLIPQVIYLFIALVSVILILLSFVMDGVTPFGKGLFLVMGTLFLLMTVIHWGDWRYRRDRQQ